MGQRRYLILLGSAALLALTACGTNELSPSPSASLGPSATESAPPTPSPSASASVTATPVRAPDPTPVQQGEGNENDQGPGYVDTSFVYPAVLVDSSTIPPAQLGNYVHFALFLDATSTTSAPNGVAHHVCVASFNGFHDCATVHVGDTMVPLDIYVLPGHSLHFGMSDSSAPMAGAFYYFEDIPDQPGFTAGSDFWFEAVLTFGDTQNAYGIFLPTMILKD